MNQTNTHNKNNIIIIIVVHIYAYSKMTPGAYLFLRKSQGMAALRVRICPHHGACPHKNILLHFAKYFFISGGNYTLVTCIP